MINLISLTAAMPHEPDDASAMVPAADHAFGIRTEATGYPTPTGKAPSYLRPHAALRRAAKGPILAPPRGHNNSSASLQSNHKTRRSDLRNSDSLNSPTGDLH
jgi:hypothetical protein